MDALENDGAVLYSEYLYLMPIRVSQEPNGR